jgi:hypothetical protein
MVDLDLVDHIVTDRGRLEPESPANGIRQGKDGRIPIKDELLFFGGRFAEEKAEGERLETAVRGNDGAAPQHPQETGGSPDPTRPDPSGRP